MSISLLLSTGRVLHLDDVATLRPAEKREVPEGFTDVVVLKSSDDPIPLRPDEARALQRMLFQPRSVTK